jgi:CubicO group peptidase (beta-lactamase class C family)
MKTTRWWDPLLGVLVLAALLSSACSAQERPRTALDDSIWPTETWPTSTPATEGIDQEAVDSLVSDIEDGLYGLVDHFLLLRHGRVVADHRFVHDYDAIAARYDTANHQYNYDHPAWHPYYRDTWLHSLQSVTKSVMSAALGIAIDEGLLARVDIPVLQFFHDYEQDRSDPRWASVTLADFLTMRSGIRWNTSGGYGTGVHSTDLLEASEEWIQFVLDQPMVADPGTVFLYNDGVSVLIGKILREATGQRPDEWAAERLFKPIGITDFYWKITPDGEVDTEGGLYLSAHDLARIGYLFLRNGEWNGDQIISREWIRASTAPVVADIAPGNDRPDAGYGFQWWLANPERPTVYSALGYGGQSLVVAPEEDLVIVINSWNIHEAEIRSMGRAIYERVLPAVRESQLEVHR